MALMSISRTSDSNIHYGPVVDRACQVSVVLCKEAKAFVAADSQLANYGDPLVDKVRGAIHHALLTPNRQLSTVERLAGAKIKYGMLLFVYPPAGATASTLIAEAEAAIATTTSGGLMTRLMTTFAAGTVAVAATAAATPVAKHDDDEAIKNPAVVSPTTQTTDPTTLAVLSAAMLCRNVGWDLLGLTEEFRKILHGTTTAFHMYRSLCSAPLACSRDDLSGRDLDGPTKQRVLDACRDISDSAPRALKTSLAGSSAVNQAWCTVMKHDLEKILCAKNDLPRTGDSFQDHGITGRWVIDTFAAK